MNATIRKDDESSPFFDEKTSYGNICRQYLDHLHDRDRTAACKLITSHAEQGLCIKSIYQHILTPVQYEVGRLWQLNLISVAQEHYMTAVTQYIMSELYRYIFNHDSTKKNASLFAACVGDELHEIGIRMVTDFFELDGWSTYYAGSNTGNKEIVRGLQDGKFDLVALSCTMSWHIPRLKELIALIRDSIPDIKILVGGGPFNHFKELHMHVGADAVAPDANIAVQWANETILPQLLKDN